MVKICLNLKFACYWHHPYIVALYLPFQQARAEQEEEFISNTLLKKIQALKKEKETLALNYEQEEECLTNDLSRKLCQVSTVSCHLPSHLSVVFLI